MVHSLSGVSRLKRMEGTSVLGARYGMVALVDERLLIVSLHLQQSLQKGLFFILRTILLHSIFVA